MQFLASNVELQNDINSLKGPKEQTEMWTELSNNVIGENRRESGPSLQNLNQRLNLFRQKKNDLTNVDLIYRHKDWIIKKLQLEEQTEKVKNHKLKERKIEELKRSGNLQFFSLKKRIEMDRITKAQKIAPPSCNISLHQKILRLQKSNSRFKLGSSFKIQSKSLMAFDCTQTILASP